MAGVSLATSVEPGMAEMAATRMSRRGAWCLIAAIGTALVGVSAIQTAWEIRESRAARPAPPDDASIAVLEQYGEPSSRGASMLHRLLAANRSLKSAIDRHEHDLEDHSIVARFLRPPTQYVLTALLGAGNEKVYCGVDRWLFYHHSVHYVTGPGFLTPRHRQRQSGEAIQTDPLKAVLDMHAQLRDRGIQLVVLPIPVKATIHPEKFARRYGLRAAAVQNPSYEAFIGAVGRAGILVCAVDSMLAGHRRAGGEAFLKDDTHWRPEMVESAARAVAALLRREGLVSACDETRYTCTRETVVGTGDLAVLLQLPEAQRSYPAQSVRIHPVMTLAGEPWRPSRDSEVLLLGDSYANIYSMEGLGWGSGAGLGAQLSLALQKPVDCILRNDNGAYATRQILRDELAREQDRLRGKRVVIYQFSARELAVGDWRLIELPTVTEVATVVFCPPSGETAAVTGVVEAISAIPRPLSVPYRDHIFTVSFRDVRSVGTGASLGRAVVYLWSMRDNALTRASRIRVGQTMALRVRPWADVADTLEGINRSELGDVVLDPCWGELLE